MLKGKGQMFDGMVHVMSWSGGYGSALYFERLKTILLYDENFIGGALVKLKQPYTVLTADEIRQKQVPLGDLLFDELADEKYISQSGLTGRVPIIITEFAMEMDFVRLDLSVAHRIIVESTPFLLVAYHRRTNTYHFVLDHPANIDELRYQPVAEGELWIYNEHTDEFIEETDAHKFYLDGRRIFITKYGGKYYVGSRLSSGRYLLKGTNGTFIVTPTQ